jgi:hypothetical protein
MDTLDARPRADQLNHRATLEAFIGAPLERINEARRHV